MARQPDGLSAPEIPQYQVLAEAVADAIGRKHGQGGQPTPSLPGGHHGGVRRVVVLGRGGAGKSVLARELGELTGLPVHELDSLFWQPDGGAASPGRWEAEQRALVAGDSWILDGDLGPYDHTLASRLRAADTIIVLDFPFLRCTWRTVRRGRERAEYWRWVWSYRRRWLPPLLQAIAAAAPQAEVHVLRSPGAVRRFTAGLRRHPPH